MWTEMKKRFSIKDFRLATLDEISRNDSGHGILGYSPRGLSTYVVYNFLKGHFGEPNQPAIDVEEKTTWNYVLKGPRARMFLSVYDWKLHSWSIGVKYPSSWSQNVKYEELTKYDEEARKDANILLDEIVQYAKTTKIPVTKYRYQWIENTHRINYSYGEHFLESLSQPVKTSTGPILSQSFLPPIFEECCIAWGAVMAFVISVEAMFNIIFEIYLKKEIREDNPLRERVFRLPLLDKWLLFASLCTCFSKPLDRNCRGYRSLKRLIMIRNSWAHAIVSDAMRTYLIPKDKLMFATKQSPVSKAIVPLISSVDHTIARKVKNDVDAIKLEILSAMRTKDKRKFAKALEQEDILISRKGTLVV